MSSLNFAIVGAGRIGTRHAGHIKNVGNLVAVCDIDENKAESLARESDVDFYNNIDELLLNKEIDVVSICTPNGLHAEHTIKALRSNKHVICEKPMALSAHDCGEMINAAEWVNKRLFIVKQNRFNPPVIAVKKALDEGRFGKIVSIQLSCFWNRNEPYYANSWKGTLNMDGGTLYTQFSHFIDLVYWMIGDIDTINGVSGNFTHNKIIEFEDAGVATIKFKNGAIGTINYNVCAYGQNMEGSLTIFGEKGTVKIGGQYLNELEYQNIENYEIVNLPPGNPANNYGQYQGSMSNHGEVYQNVVEVLTKDGKIAANGFEGLKTIEIIEEFYKIARGK